MEDGIEMKQTKVLLINPPGTTGQFTTEVNYFPIGLLTIGSVLKENNADVKVIDVFNAFYNKELNDTILEEYIKDNILKTVETFKPDIIGIGCLFSGAFDGLKQIAKTIKHNFPSIPIAIGGIHPTIFPKEILDKCGFIDYIILGEGDYTFNTLVDSITNKDERYKSINGIAFREKNIVKINPKTEFIKDLDSLPFIDYSLIDVEDYYNMDTSNWYSPKGLRVGQPFSIISSRSCPNRCSFCAMRLINGDRWRARSPENVVDEIEHLYYNYGVRYFQFMDDNLTLNKKRIIAICKDIIERGLDIQFDPQNGVAINRLDEETIGYMVNAGLVKIDLPIESGDERIRNDCIHKHLPTEKIYEIFDICKKYNHLFIRVFFIIGMPQETHESLEASYKMMQELPMDKFRPTFACPYPGTELFDYCIEHKLISGDFVDIGDMHGSADHPFFKPHNLSIDDLLEFKKRCTNLYREKRSASELRWNYPLRYKHEGG